MAAVRGLTNPHWSTTECRNRDSYSLAGIALMLVLHQTAKGGEHEVLILGQHHERAR
jgi:hypothetical protein